jgi:hypothetical protein
VKILFVMLHPGFIRYYDGALRRLAAAGHDVHVAFEVTRDKLGEDVTAQRLAAGSARITCGTTPERVESVRTFLARADRSATRSGSLFRSGAAAVSSDVAWASLATTVRLLVDYLRFFEPAFAHASALRERAGKRLPRLHAGLVRAVARGGAGARALFASALRSVERLIPPTAGLEAFIRSHSPDVLLVTPLIELGSQQVDYVKCARHLGVPSALCVASWDNLTSKGLIRLIPDHVVVWNEAQKTEAVALHGVPPDRVLVTGAQLFDDWFDAGPSRSREEFCRLVGLDPSRPFVVYAGSSMFIAPDEVPFAERWLSHLRGSGDALIAALGVLIRPHPANARQWHAFDRAAFPNVAVWPPIGTDPNAPDFRQDYSDSLLHGSAVVGINTSAQLEAAIVGRPVFTIRAPEFAHAQEGTLHFRHLVGDDSGPVQAADSLDEHAAQLARALRGGIDREAQRRFVQAFIRPHGLDRPAAPAFVEAIDAIARRPRPLPRPDPLWVRALRRPAAGFARVARALAEDRPIWVYLLRPFVIVAVWLAAGVFWLRHRLGGTLFAGARRLRRAWHVAWYESLRHRAKTLRRARKSLSKGVLHAGVTAKRVLRRARNTSGGRL